MAKIYFELGGSYPEASLHIISTDDASKPNDDDCQGEVQVHNCPTNRLHLEGYLPVLGHHMHKEDHAEESHQKQASHQLSLL